MTNERGIEAALRASQEHLRFLDRLAAATQPLSDATRVMAVTARLLGEHLGVAVCAYADMEPDQDRLTIRGNWTASGAPSIVGTYSLAGFGERAVRELRAGLPLVTRDTLAELGPEQAALLQLGLKATVCMPLVKDGRLAALMAVHAAQPRDWTQADLTLVADTVQRSWAHVERTRSEAGLRESEARFRCAVRAVQGVLWTNDADGRMTGEQPGWAALTGQTLEEYRDFGWTRAVHPDDAPATTQAWLAAVAARCIFVHEHRVRRALDGAWRTFSIRAMPALAEDGSVREWVGVHTDVTDQRTAEAALRASEELNRRMLDASTDCIKVLDIGARLEFMSDGGMCIMEVEDLGAVKGACWPDFWRGEEHAKALAAIEEARRGGTGRFQGYADTMQGTPRWWDVIVTPINGPDGRPEKLLSVSRDVTAAKKVEEALRASETRFRTALQIDTVGAIYFDLEGRLTDANDAFLRMSGYDRADLEAGGLTWQSFTPVEWMGDSQRAFAELKEHRRTIPYEKEYIRKDGSRWWALFAAKLLPDNTGFDFVLDITDRKRAEARLHDLNETLEQRVAERSADLDRVWRLSRDLLAVTETDGALRSVNAAWTNLLGWREDELVGGKFKFIHPDDLDATMRTFADILLTPLVVPYENRLRAKDGTYRWLAWTAAFENGAVYATGRDVTGEKEQAAALVQTEEQLRQAQKMEAVGQLTGGVAHDFNNLLTIIKSSTDLLRRPGLADERKGRYVDAISNTVDRASKLTGQLLAFARRQALKREVFDAADRIRAIVEMLRTVVGSRIRIETDFDPQPHFVETDASQFETALVNMVVNARDAMREQGVLAIRVGNVACLPSIRGEAGSAGRYVAVAIADTGVGIPADRLSRIFEPFYTTKEVGKGTGLGLSQTFGFAKQSGGNIAVESELGRGSTFTLYLPEVERPAEAAERPAGLDAEPLRTGRGRRVLVVEDNVDVGTFSTQLLQDLGYETTWAANADEALSLIDAVESFDVVFSDVVMPGMSGVELGQEIRRRRPGLPIVLTSGYSHVLAEEGRHGFELLQKPYAAEDLSKILRRATRRGSRQARGGA